MNERYACNFFSLTTLVQWVYKYCRDPLKCTLHVQHCTKGACRRQKGRISSFFSPPFPVQIGQMTLPPSSAGQSPFFFFFSPWWAVVTHQEGLFHPPSPPSTCVHSPSACLLQSILSAHILHRILYLNPTHT